MVERKRAIGPAEDVERGRDDRCAGERDAERELVRTGGGGRGDVVEFGREDLAEDAIDFGAGRFNFGNDYGDAGVGLRVRRARRVRRRA